MEESPNVAQALLSVPASLRSIEHRQECLCHINSNGPLDRSLKLLSFEIPPARDLV